VIAGPGNERAAAERRGRGDLRASRADREQVIELLKAAFVEDRLTKEELDARVGQALASRTYADLAAVTADIPAGLIAGQPPREPARAQDRPPMSNAAKAVISVAVAVAVPAVLTLATGLAVWLVFVPFYFMALLAAGAQILFSRYEKRSRRQLPPRPGHGGKAAEGQRPGPADDDPALPGARPDQTRADLRTHRSRPGRSHSSGRSALAPRGIRPVPDAG
jgi:hypothetical protein